jgi:mannose-6-phosphate isomerase-like protein (cupin superfamily)
MNTIETFDITELTDKMAGEPVEYLEFLKVPRLSCGIYRLGVGETDPQLPHEEDEIYYVISGSAKFRTDTGEENITTGSVLYVAASAEHRFVDVSEALTLLVFFAAN